MFLVEQSQFVSVKRWLVIGYGHQPIVALHRLEFSVEVVDVDLEAQVQVQNDKPSERENQMV